MMVGTDRCDYLQESLGLDKVVLVVVVTLVVEV